MSQDPSKFEQQSPDSQSRINQHISGNSAGTGNQQAAIYGDGNTVYQILIDTRPDVELADEPIHFQSWKDYLLNYIKTLLLLISVSISWVFMGLFATNAFPHKLTNDLIKYIFLSCWENLQNSEDFLNRATSDMWLHVKNMLSSLDNLNGNSDYLLSINFNENSAKYLNKIDSQYWLLARLLEILDENSDSSDIFWKIKDLENRREKIRPHLDNLKKVYLPDLYSFEKFIEATKLSGKSKMADEVEKILNELVAKYINVQYVSQIEVLELIEALEEKAANTPKNSTIYSVWQLANWLYTQLQTQQISSSRLSSIDSNCPPIRALKNRNNYKSRYHIPNGCNLYPKVSKQDDIDKIDFYQSSKEAENAGRVLCRHCRKRLQARS